MTSTLGVIFDMDGTLLDNNPFHLKAWQFFFKPLGIELSEKQYKAELSGMDSDTTIRLLLGGQLTEQEVNAYRNAKEALYRQLIAPHIRPLAGLLPFLDQLLHAHLPIGIATSATPDNIHFAMEQLGLKAYFEVIIDATMVKQGKPDPEIYRCCAKRMHVEASRCVVFEDSLNGIRGARAAGMKVVAIATAHARGVLRMADMVVEDYTQIDLHALQTLMQSP